MSAIERLGANKPKLTASDGTVKDNFGIGVSVNGDTAVIGANLDDDNGNASGSAYVYVRNGTTWSEQAKLTASDGTANDNFGYSVSVSGDIAIIGARYDDDNGIGSGSAYMYVRNGTNWSEQTKLTASDSAAGDRLGISVSVSGDTAVIGADKDDDRGNDSGSAYFYEAVQYRIVNFDLGDHGIHSGGGSLSQQVLNGDSAQAPLVDAASGWIFDKWDTDFNRVTSNLTVTALYLPAYSVTYNLGNLATLAGGSLNQIVGEGHAATPPAISVATGNVFTGWDKSNLDITENTEISAQFTPEPLAGFMESREIAEGGNRYSARSISIDGDITLIGADGYVNWFIRNNRAWSEKGVFTSNDSSPNDYFGNSVSISGNTALVGAYNDDEKGTRSGSAYIFVRKDNIWTEQAKLTASDGMANDRFGSSVAIYGDIALVGAPYDDNHGSVYVFVRNGNTWTEHSKLVASDGSDYDYFGFSISIDKNTAIIGAYNFDNAQGYLHSGTGAAYIFSWDGNTWTETTRLSAMDGAVDDFFGHSVCISGKNVLVGAYGNGTSGSAYVFVENEGVWSEHTKLNASDSGVDDRFAYSVSLDGDIAFIGAYGDDHNGVYSGSAYVFAQDSNGWTEKRKITASNSAQFDQFGRYVSICGNVAVTSAYKVDSANNDSGSAYFYDLAVPPATVTFDLNNKSSRVGGGTLIQLIKIGTPAIAPTIDPNPGWLFDTWDSEFNSVTDDLVVTALYTIDPDDTDGDIMDDTWETTYFGSTAARNGSGDFDKDGKRDLDEFITGNDPIDSSDYFHVIEQDFTAGLQNITLSFSSSDNHPDRRYRIFLQTRPHGPSLDGIATRQHYA